MFELYWWGASKWKCSDEAFWAAGRIVPPPLHRPPARPHRPPLQGDQAQVRPAEDGWEWVLKFFFLHPIWLFLLSGTAKKICAGTPRITRGMGTNITLEPGERVRMAFENHCFYRFIWKPLLTSASCWRRNSFLSWIQSNPSHIHW